jgi:plastocyanin
MLFSPVHQRRILVIIHAIALLFSGSACTMTVRAIVQDEHGNPVQNAVVYASPAAQNRVPAQQTAKTGTVAGKRDRIDLIDQQIVPLVLPVRVGTAVEFWNRDAIQHQIYSISPAKQFELTIDKGASSVDPVFDKPGVVVMGSAINDRMIGYVYVLKTPWFARTGEDGTAELRDLPKGTYDVRVWHPGMKSSPEATKKRVAPSSLREANAKFSLALQPSAHDPGSKPPPAPLPAAEGR